jgi:hypothetical protein
MQADRASHGSGILSATDRKSFTHPRVVIFIFCRVHGTSSIASGWLKGHSPPKLGGEVFRHDLFLNSAAAHREYNVGQRLVDAWSFRDNNVAKGEPPKLISESGNEADRGKSGLHGLPSSSGDGHPDTSGGAGDDRRTKGQTGSPLRKADSPGRRVVFFKAAPSQAHRARS